MPKPTPGPKEVLVKIAAAALNHRDHFQRQHLYPKIAFGRPLFGDGFGTVVELGPGADRALLHKSVLLSPIRGWDADPIGPEKPGGFSIIGATTLNEAGAGQEYVAVPQDEVLEAPAHLTPAEGAALPLVGLTGWRALVTKSGNAAPGRNILITGIGGGVALQTLQFAVALGCNVWVTSGDKDKIERAKKLGAEGGVVYKDKDWHAQLAKLLPKERPYLDAIIDGAGGDIMARASRLLKAGGVVSQYGMTVSPEMKWSMSAVLQNIELRGSTMGSKREFRDMVDLVRKKQIRPVVSQVVKGLDNLEGIETLFDEIKHGRQFGKLVIEFDQHKSSASKL